MKKSPTCQGKWEEIKDKEKEIEEAARAPKAPPPTLVKQEPKKKGLFGKLFS